MAEGDTLEIQIDKLGKSLVASRGEFKETAKLLKAAQAHIAQLEALGPTPSGETVKAFVDSSITAGVAAASNELMQRCAALETQLTASTKTADEANTKFASAAVTNELREACRSQHIKPEAVGDVVAIGSTELKLIDGQVVTDDGRSAADWLDTRKSISGYWWPVARGAGAGRGSSADMPVFTGTNPFLKTSWNMTSQSQIAASNPGLATRLKAEADASMMNK
jgi:hypothetical protein